MYVFNTLIFINRIWYWFTYKSWYAINTVPSTLRTMSPIRSNKQCNAQGSTKLQQRTNSTESMDNDTDHRVAILNLEEILNNYNPWNCLTVGKLISSLTLLNVHLLHIVYIYLNVYKQMTDVKLLLLQRNSRNYLCANKWLKVNRMICSNRNTCNHFNWRKMSLFKNVFSKMFTNHMYLI